MQVLAKMYRHRRAGDRYSVPVGQSCIEKSVYGRGVEHKQSLLVLLMTMSCAPSALVLLDRLTFIDSGRSLNAMSRPSTLDDEGRGRRGLDQVIVQRLGVELASHRSGARHPYLFRVEQLPRVAGDAFARRIACTASAASGTAVNRYWLLNDQTADTTAVRSPCL